MNAILVTIFSSFSKDFLSMKLLRLTFCFAIICFSFFDLQASNYYWVNGTGKWGDYSTHWATSSGGVLYYTKIPTSNDNVYFDSNSFISNSDTVYLDSSIINCKTMDWSTATNSPVFKGSPSYYYGLNISESLILSLNMKWDFSSNLIFNSSTSGNIINLNGQSIQDSIKNTIIVINGSGSFDLLNDITIQAIIIQNGNFNSNNYTINSQLSCSTFDILNPINIQLGTSIINGSSYFGDNLIVDADSATFNVIGFNSNTSITFNKVICHGNINAINSSFDFVKCNSIFGDNNVFNEVQFFDLNGDYFSNFNSNSNYLIGSKNIFHKTVIPCSYISISGKQTFDSLSFNNPGQIIKLGGDTITINNNLEIGGTCSGLTTIIAPVDTATIIISGGTIIFDYLYLKNIKASGNSNITLNNSIDAGGNSGCNINSPITRLLYWVGGTGNWNDISHWSALSGGIGGECVPTKFDSLYFDVNSFATANDTVYANTTFLYCSNFDWSGVINHPVFQGSSIYSQLDIYHSFYLNPLMTFNYNGNIRFLSDSTNNVLNTYGLKIPSTLIFEGTGIYNLQNDLNDSLNNFIHGTFNTNNYHLTGSFNSTSISSNVTINLGSSLIDGDAFNFFSGSNIIVSGMNASFNVIHFTSPDGTSYTDVKCNSLGANYCTFNNVICTALYGNNNVFQNVIFDGATIYYGGILIVSNGNFDGTNNIFHTAKINTQKFTYGNNGYNPVLSYNSFDSLLFSIPGQEIYFYNTNNITINNFLSINGSCTGTTSLLSLNGFVTIHKNGIPVNTSYLYLANIHVNGTAFTANNTIDAGGNIGWNITAPSKRSLFWVGGKGNYSDSNHWSLISGGVGGACIPNRFDDVNFDSNSFLSIGDTVFSYFENLNFHSMNWNGVLNFPAFFNYGNTLNVYGSFILSANMYLHFDASLLFNSKDSGNIINTNGQSITSNNPWAYVRFIGTGTWDLKGDITADYIYFNNGTFYSNGYKVVAGAINQYSQEIAPTLYFGTSVIQAIGDINFNGTGTILHADSCTIIANRFCSDGGSKKFNIVKCNSFANIDSCNINYAECDYVYGDHSSFNDFHFTNNYNIIYGSNNYFHKVIIPSSNFEITGYNTFDTLVFNSAGQAIVFNPSSVTTINNYLQINSSQLSHSTLSCANGVATIIVPNDTVCTDYIDLQNINATGGAVFYAGANSNDLGNNSGWIWSSCDPDTNGIWPGDANYDLVVDNTDLLYLGIAYGYTGSIRNGASNNWTAQPSIDWLQQFANGINIKNADCDGNGIINDDDTLAVSLNYGQTHPYRLSNQSLSNIGGANLYFDMPTGNLSPGTLVSIPIMLGSISNPATNLYGSAFTINYDPTYVQAGTIEIDFSNSWLGNSLNTIHLTKDNSTNGMIDIGFVKTDHQNSNGNGLFATIIFKVANGVSGNMQLSFSKIFAIDKNENKIPIQPISSTIYTSLNEVYSLTNMISVYPNPASSRLTIYDPNNIIQNISLNNRIGQSVFQSGKINYKEINLDSFDDGIYFLEIRTLKGILNKKIVIKK